jgi:hypothetical protein
MNPNPPAVPTSLEGWTLVQLRGLLTQGVFETDRFDFKLELPHSRSDEGKRRMRGTIAAFANSSGGFLVLGVHDDRSLSVEARLVGIDTTKDVPEAFGSLASAIEPGVDYFFKNPPIQLADPNLLIHVIHVPSSPRGPHGIENDGRWWFPKRTSRGNDAMSREELRGAFTDLKQRAATARMIGVELHRISRLAETLNRDSFHAHGVSMPPSLYLTHYRSAALAGALSFVLAEVHDDFAVRSFQEILDATSGSDLLVAQLYARRVSERLSDEEADWMIEMIRDFARRIMHESEQFQTRSHLKHFQKRG